jgi:molybdopterin-guanine dinucleotide biosynthesis protein A
MPGFDAVILAGGKAARMAGVDKPGLSVGGTAMLVLVAQAAATAGAKRLIIVGPDRPGAVRDGISAISDRVPSGVVWVSEQPSGGGPVPAVRRGLAEVTAEWLTLLASDMPFLDGGHISALLAGALRSGSAGAVLADASERPQWLASTWQAATLRTALSTYAGDSLRRLLAPQDFVLMRLAASADGRAPWLDCDTPEDLAAARESLNRAIHHQ